jgi:CRP-like cAMP-binding protein
VARNDVIYRQGDEGHYYFFMLKGSVSLLSRRADFGNFDLFLKSYYDGDFFGEQPLLLTKQGESLASEEQLRQLSLRDSTCIANDDCWLLEISNAVKQEFYRTDSTNHYESCIHWLRKSPIFKMTEGFYLLQMIFNIDRRVYRLGEALVRSGDTPEGMFIIISG